MRQLISLFLSLFVFVFTAKADQFYVTKNRKTFVVVKNGKWQGYEVYHRRVEGYLELISKIERYIPFDPSDYKEALDRIYLLPQSSSGKSLSPIESLEFKKFIVEKSSTSFAEKIVVAEVNLMHEEKYLVEFSDGSYAELDFHKYQRRFNEFYRTISAEEFEAIINDQEGQVSRFSQGYGQPLGYFVTVLNQRYAPSRDVKVWPSNHHDTTFQSEQDWDDINEERDGFRWGLCSDELKSLYLRNGRVAE